MQKTLTHNLIKNFILNNPNYSFKPYYPYSNKYLFGFSDTYKLKNNTKCHRHKYYFTINFNINNIYPIEPFKHYLNQLQQQFNKYNFTYTLEDVFSNQTGEYIATKLTTRYYTNN